MRVTLIIVSFFLFTHLQAQDRVITGLILDKHTNKPVALARVSLSGRDTIIFTSTRGVFQFKVPKELGNPKLTISHIGYYTSEVNIPEQDQFRMSLEKDIVKLPDFDFTVMKQQARITEFITSIESLKPGDQHGYYKAGLKKLFEDLYKRSQSSTLAKENYQGKIYFTLNDKGSLENFALSPADSTSTGREIISLFTGLTEWQAATQNGVPTSETFSIHLSFNNNKKSKIVRGPTNDEDFQEIEPIITFLLRNLKYPAAARRVGVEGKVIVSFELDDDSNIIKILLLDDIGADCGKEIINTLSNTPLEVLNKLPKQTRSFLLPVIFGLDFPPVNLLLQTRGTIYALPTITIRA